MTFPYALLPNRDNIKANIDKAITVKEYAQRFGYSPSYVCRLWKQRRLDGIKLRGHIFVLPNAPVLRYETKKLAEVQKKSRNTM
jgi:AraC-like DNA-binding protein